MGGRKRGLDVDEGHVVPMIDERGRASYQSVRPYGTKPALGSVLTVVISFETTLQECESNRVRMHGQVMSQQCELLDKSHCCCGFTVAGRHSRQDLKRSPFIHTHVRDHSPHTLLFIILAPHRI